MEKVLPINTMPVGLIEIVYKYLPKKYLKMLRHVCRSLSRVAVRYIVDKFFISAHKADLEVAKLIRQNFAPYVKKLGKTSSIFSQHVIAWSTSERWYLPIYGADTRLREVFKTERSSVPGIATYETSYILKH